MDSNTSAFNITALLAGVLVTLGVLLYRAASSKPIPGILCAQYSINRLFGDVPDALKYHAKPFETVAFLASRCEELKSPIVQVFVRPFPRPWVVLADSPFTVGSSITSNDVSHVAGALPILAEVNQEIRSDSEDRAFWWEAMSGTLATLLQYSDEAQRHYLRWFCKWIPPALGPRPINSKPYYGSWLTHDLSPFEFSINWKEKSRKQIIRFTLEPTTKQAGTAIDPINQLGTKEFMNTISKDVPGLDLTRFNQFLEATNVPSDGVDDAIAKHPPNFPRCRAVVAFDLEHSGDLMVKSYVLPHWRVLQSGIPAQTIISDAVRACNGPDGLSYDGSMDAIMSYLSTFEGREDAPLARLLSNDCVADTPGMRLKVYILSDADSLTKLNEMYSLGGRLKGDHIAASLEGIRELWYHLFGLSGSDLTANDKVCVDKMKCVFVYEMRSTHGSEPDLDVKLHIPMWQLGKSDGQLSEVMAPWFESHGHPDLAARYKSDLNKALYSQARNHRKYGCGNTYLDVHHLYAEDGALHDYVSQPENPRSLLLSRCQV